MDLGPWTMKAVDRITTTPKNDAIKTLQITLQKRRLILTMTHFMTYLPLPDSKLAVPYTSRLRNWLVLPVKYFPCTAPLNQNDSSAFFLDGEHHSCS